MVPKTRNSPEISFGEELVCKYLTNCANCPIAINYKKTIEGLFAVKKIVSFTKEWEKLYMGAVS